MTLDSGDFVHYSAGLGGLVAAGGAATLPDHGLLWMAARITLDATGALFGLYLVVFIVLLLWGWAISARRRAAAGKAGA